MDVGRWGRMAGFFQSARITPLLALLALLLGAFAIIVTPREEEPLIDVTMANVIVAFPGASVRDVEQMVAGPAEQMLARMSGVEHVSSVSRAGLAVLTVQFKVGVPRTEALVRLNDTVQSNADWLPQGLGVAPPLVKPKGIDDVPIVTLTLHGKDGLTSAFDLERIAHSLEADLKRVRGTRDVVTVGGPGRVVRVELDPARMMSAGIDVADLRRALQSANSAATAGQLVAGDRSIDIEAGPPLRDARELAGLVVGTRNGRPIALRDVASVAEGAPVPRRYAWHGTAGAQPGQHPAVTIAITKKAGENASDVADAVLRRVDDLRNTLIPAGVEVVQTRNYGATANDKAMKLVFATASVVALVFVALGRREAAVVGSAVVLTLAATLFASWAWGFTLNRVSLFALIFSIGILVDDAIVVVENIHRHAALAPDRPLADLIPAAVALGQRAGSHSGLARGPAAGARSSAGAGAAGHRRRPRPAGARLVAAQCLHRGQPRLRQRRDRHPWRAVRGTGHGLVRGCRVRHLRHRRHGDALRRHRAAAALQRGAPRAGAAAGPRRRIRRPGARAGAPGADAAHGRGLLRRGAGPCPAAAARHATGCRAPGRGRGAGPLQSR
jgi:multidrug efflux pump subunit AcrB